MEEAKIVTKISIVETLRRMKVGQVVHFRIRQVLPQVCCNTAQRLQKTGEGRWKVSQRDGDTTITRIS